MTRVERRAGGAAADRLRRATSPTRGCGFPYLETLGGAIPRRLAIRDASGMTRTLLIGIVVLGMLVLATGGWTVRGVRRVLRAPGAARPLPAT